MANNSLHNNQVVSCPVMSSKTLGKMIDEVKVQVGFYIYGEKWAKESGAMEWFDESGKFTYINTPPPLISEMCLVIAEVFCLNPILEINIESQPVAVALVQEVYGRLTHKHISVVLEKYNLPAGNRQITRKKSYMRTLLYNSVFEMESYNHDRATWGV